MVNAQNLAPIIPAGTSKSGGGKPAYDPLIEIMARDNGQAGEAPEASQSVAKTQQTSETMVPTGTTFAELAAKKGFNSPDDLAKAYIEAEQQKTRVEMGLSELIKLRNESQPAESEVDQLNVESTDEDAVKVVEKVVRRFTRPLEDRLALQDLFFKNPDAKDFASVMAKVVKDNPGITWDAAYKVAKFDTLSKDEREKGRQEAYSNIQQKQVGTVESQRSATISKDTRNLEDIIRDRSIPFQEVQRIMKERFSQ